MIPTLLPGRQPLSACRRWRRAIGGRDPHMTPSIVSHSPYPYRYPHIDPLTTVSHSPQQYAHHVIKSLPLVPYPLNKDEVLIMDYPSPPTL